MARKWLALATSLCALAIAPATAAADSGKGWRASGHAYKAGPDRHERKPDRTVRVERRELRTDQCERSGRGDEPRLGQRPRRSVQRSRNRLGFPEQQRNRPGEWAEPASKRHRQGRRRAGLVRVQDAKVSGQQVEQDQQASNSNSTEQQASSEAHSKQVNVNAPVAVMSPGSDNGDVYQSNQAQTVAASQNNNSTEQGNFQNQEANAARWRRRRDSRFVRLPGLGKGGDHGAPAGRPEPEAVQQQRHRARTPKATPRTEQKNINKGGSGVKRISLRGRREPVGCSGGGDYGDAGKHGDHGKGSKPGDVNQSNAGRNGRGVAEQQRNRAGELPEPGSERCR